MNNLVRYRFVLFATGILTVLLLAAWLTGNNPPISHDPSTFRITGATDGEACYIGLVYIDGYIYLNSGWDRYPYDSKKISKGEKTGEVGLDLKGKNYVGIPPDFASTYDAGTEIYTVSGRRIEYAIIVVDHYNNHSILYRQGKATADYDDSPLNISVSEVINMIADSPSIIAVDFLDENYGSWLRTSEDELLLTLINSELPGQSLLTAAELGQSPSYQRRIPVNLMFKGGEALQMHVFPIDGIASVFGGFVRLSPVLSSAFQDLAVADVEFPSLADLLPYTKDQVDYLYFKNHTNGDEVWCENPLWSGGALFEIFSLHRVTETEPMTGEQLVVTSVLGKTEKESITIQMHRTRPGDDALVIEINGIRYKPVRGRIYFDDIEQYLYNYTELGHKLME